MKTVISALLTFLLAISPVPAANQAPASSDEQALLQLENDCEAARMRRDVEATVTDSSIPDVDVDASGWSARPDGQGEVNRRTGFITFKSSKVGKRFGSHLRRRRRRLQPAHADAGLERRRRPRASSAARSSPLRHSRLLPAVVVATHLTRVAAKLTDAASSGAATC